MTNEMNEHFGFNCYWQIYDYALDSFEVKYLSQEVLNKIKEKSITHNIFIIQDDGSIMCGFYHVALIEYMLARKAFLDYNIFFSPNNYSINDKKIYNYFKDRYDKPSL